MLGNRVTNERINKIGYKQSKKLNVNVYFFAGNHPPPPPPKKTNYDNSVFQKYDNFK